MVVCLSVSTDREGNKEWLREIKLNLFTATVPNLPVVMWRQFESHLHSSWMPLLCVDLWMSRPLSHLQSPPSGLRVYDAT